MIVVFSGWLVVRAGSLSFHAQSFMDIKAKTPSAFSTTKVDNN